MKRQLKDIQTQRTRFRPLV